MDVNTIANILVAVTVAHGLHSVLEPTNILNKVRELDALVNNKTSDVKIPKGIDTRPKAYMLGLLSFLIPFGITFGVLSLFDLNIKAAMIFSILVLIGVEVINTMSIDRFHIEIERIAKKFRK